MQIVLHWLGRSRAKIKHAKLCKRIRCVIECCTVLQCVAVFCRVLQGFTGCCRVFWLGQSHANSKHAKLCKRIRCVCVCIYVCEREKEYAQACASCVYTHVCERESKCVRVCASVCARACVCIGCTLLQSVAVCYICSSIHFFLRLLTIQSIQQHFPAPPVLIHVSFFHPSCLLRQVRPTSDFNRGREENQEEKGHVKNTRSLKWSSFFVSP